MHDLLPLQTLFSMYQEQNGVRFFNSMKTDAVPKPAETGAIEDLVTITGRGEPPKPAETAQIPAERQQDSPANDPPIEVGSPDFARLQQAVMDITKSLRSANTDATGQPAPKMNFPWEFNSLGDMKDNFMSLILYSLQKNMEKVHEPALNNEHFQGIVKSVQSELDATPQLKG